MAGPRGAGTTSDAGARSLRAAALFVLRRQGLMGPTAGGGATTALELARAMGGIQAQVPRAALLQAGARLPSLDPATWRAALESKRALVRSWTVRATLHVVPADLYPLMLSATRDAWFGRWGAYLTRRLGPARPRAMRAVVDALERRGGIASGEELAADLRAAPRLDLPQHIPMGTIVTGALKDACYEGHVVLGGSARGRTLYALTAAWLGGTLAGGPARRGGAPAGGDGPSPAAALLRLYLHCHAPATVQDFAHWSCLTVAEARAAAAELDDELEPVELPGLAGRYLIAADDRACLDRCLADAGALAPDDYPVHLLPEYDDLALGHADRARFIDAAYYRLTLKPAGHIEPLLLAGGRVAGIWKHHCRGHRLDIEVLPFAAAGHPAPCGGEARRGRRAGRGRLEAAVEAAGQKVAQLWGLSETRVAWGAALSPSG